MDEHLLFQTDQFQITQLDFLIRMLVAAGIGFVIGLEREHASISEKEEKFAGVRTFAIVSLLGYFSTLMSILFNPWVFLAGMAGITALIGISYWASARTGEIGGTTELTALLVYLLGGATLLGHIEASLSLMVVVVVLLSLKVRLHSLIGQISQRELYAFIRFVVIALLILPFLPDQTYGPYQVINPREIGWVIVLTSGIGFVGYMLMKFLGSQRGILLTGIVGGFVSSTVVTWIFAKKSKNIPDLSAPCTVAILAASTIMVIRVVVWILVFNQALLPRLAFPLLMVFAAGLGTAWYFYYTHRDEATVEADIPLGEPLNLRDALFFGLLYSGILLLISFANQQFGQKGIYLSTGIAALTDIDAIVISVSKLGGESLGMLTAQNAILLATLSNTIVKIVISLYAGSRELRKHVLAGYGLIFAAGLLGFFLINW